MACSVVSAIARKSSACATGWPWKFPPESTSPDSNTSGLSVEAFSSIRASLSSEPDRVDHCPHHLRRAAKTVRILHPVVIFPVRLPDLAVGQQVAHQLGRAELAWMGPIRVNSRIERHRSTPQRLQRHRRSADRRAPQDLGVVHQQRQQSGLRLRAVDEGDPLLGRETEWHEAGRRECLVCPPIATKYLALTHQRQRDVAERCQVTARADTSLLRDPAERGRC